MQRISQFFKKLFSSTPKGDLIPKSTKREVILTEKAARPVLKKSSRLLRYEKQQWLHKEAIKRKEANGGLPTVSFGTFSPVKPLPIAKRREK